MVFDTKWILVVDDEEEIRNSLIELLKLTFGEDKMKVVESRNGIEATAKIKNQKFDCIITDLKMPKKEGDALIMSVRQNPLNDSTPVVVLTGFPDERILNDYRFTYLMEKPYLHNELTDLVGHQLKIGRDGGRLAADMVNGLVEATKLFLAHTLSTDEINIESPMAKKSGEPIMSEYVSQVNISDDGVRNSFSLMVGTEDLKKLAESLPSVQGKSMDRIGYALGQSILNYALKTIVNRGGGSFNVISMSPEESPGKLLHKKGIVIPMNCKGISIDILACGEKKAS